SPRRGATGCPRSASGSAEARGFGPLRTDLWPRPGIRATFAAAPPQRRHESWIMKPKSVLVIGLGRFGTSIVETLWKSRAEVIAVDNNPEAVDAVKDMTSAAFVGDATVPKVLEGIGAQSVDTAIVTFGE